MYLLDSCVCLDLMRGRLPIAYHLMRRSDPKQFKIPAIVMAELEYGVQHAPNPSRVRLLTERFLAPFEIVPFDATCARAYGAIRQQLRAAGKPIGPNDILIASMAVAYQAVLATNNVREFKHINGLRVESWYEADVYI